MPADELFAKLSDLTLLQSKVESLPDDVKAKVGEMRFTADSVVIVTPQAGEIELKIKESVAPSKIVFGTAQSVVPLDMSINIKPIDDASSELTSSIEVDIPFMLRPIVGPQLQKAADGFGDSISKLFVN